MSHFVLAHLSGTLTYLAQYTYQESQLFGIGFPIQWHILCPSTISLKYCASYYAHLTYKLKVSFSQKVLEKCGSTNYTNLLFSRNLELQFFCIYWINLITNRYQGYYQNINILFSTGNKSFRKILGLCDGVLTGSAKQTTSAKILLS